MLGRLIVRGLVVWAIGLPASGCGSDGGTPDPCPNGICPAGDGDFAGTGAAMGTDAATGGAMGTGGATGGGGATGSGGMGGSGGCTEAWACTPWATGGGDDSGTRSCTDGNACGTTALKPAGTANLPALDFNYYQCNVEPILDRGCAHLGCHGTEEGRALRVYARGRLRITGDTLVTAGLCLNGAGSPPKATETCTGSVECACWARPHTMLEWRANFDAARGFALDPAGQVLASVEDSELLTQPLIGGGLSHAGIKMWTAGSPEYATIRDWLSGQSLPSCGLPQSQN